MGRPKGSKDKISKRILAFCPTCKKQIHIQPSFRNKNKYCSRKCYNISQRGHHSWNTGKHWSIEIRKKFSEIHKNSPACQVWHKKLREFSKGKHYSPGTEFKKGQHTSPKTEFKKGMIPHNFKGRFKDSRGYILLNLPTHPFAHKKNNTVPEHRLVVEKQIGRYLIPTEFTHHINEIKDDNRPNNLMAFSSCSAHRRFHYYPDRVKPEEIIFDGRLLKS